VSDQPEGFEWVNKPYGTWDEGSAPAIKNVPFMHPMTHEQIGQLFEVSMTTTDPNVNIAELIAAVRKVERFHGIL
jgi:hypothetical protein